MERFRENLTQAGFYADRHLQYLLAAKMAAAGLLGVVSYGVASLSIGALRALLFGVTLGVLGFYLPNVWLGRRIKARQTAITRQLADALDLLSIGVGAASRSMGACWSWSSGQTTSLPRSSPWSCAR